MNKSITYCIKCNYCKSQRNVQYMLIERIAEASMGSVTLYPLAGNSKYTSYLKLKYGTIIL